MTALALHLDAPMPYREGLRIQDALVGARQSDEIPDVVLFLEHTPVVTLGNRGRRDHLLLAEEDLARHGIDLVHASRGGDVTWHGPGQVVMYPILRLGTHEADAHGYLWNLEEIAVRTAADFGIKAYRRDGMNGAWTDAGKIAAIGFRLKRWVTCHGMSFNVDCDLDGFRTIVPCGLVGERVASMKTLLGPKCPELGEVREAMARHFEDVCGRRLEIPHPERPVPAPIRDILDGLSA